MTDNKYKYEVNNIKVENNEGLFAFFDVKLTDEDGDVQHISAGEWIDLDDGLLVHLDRDSNLNVNTDDIDDIREVWDQVNNWLRENPISEETLEEYRIAKAEREEEISSRYSM